MTPQQFSKLEELRSRLTAVQPYPWSNMEAWIAAASPFFRTVLKQFRSDFDEITDTPAWSAHVRVVSGGSIYDPNSRRDNFAEADAAEERENSALAAAAKARVLAWLDSIIDLHRADNAVTQPEPVQVGPVSATRRVFVVHGHDSAAREAVARFLERLELEPVVLSEHPNEGRTIIEKFEHHADVRFAVVLLTPDDIGYSAAKPENPRNRARQNVILELGYFVGRLGRSQVCALHKGELELPSDLHGVVYVPMDEAEGWKLRLAKEIKAAGLAIDMNRAV